ncbi:two-component system chemotaxis response regulator CheY [Hydrogenivirga caldilitoris]|uniref:histidine kinase n=1 Tax=Hydrogenivirga caldilitoris TaxID=246264 RepID=A0A497XSK0_9AQUI|nr:chemotaxis response regulator CheY [Hydrogenivirga caldilitoris]RLJ71130.1 two-component system chemotaxis response regulator CheY [Hydrogenivirga caldilitoris]
MPMPPTSIKILVVDDMSTMRRIIKTILNQLGYTNIEEAENGKQALAKLKKEKYDFVVTDWNMPEMDGLSLVKAIRNDEELKHIPILMVTAEAKKENVMEALKAGVNNYIVKPFTPEVLKEKMEKIFK